jgi:muramoyltetrapeptide carboxypeptidase LdcA involved in peptidoglycan recycling
MQRDAVNTEFGPVTKEMLLGIIANNATLKNIPIIANVDFGHTHPIFTFPIGGRVKMSAVQGKARIGIVKH